MRVSPGDWGHAVVARHVFDNIRVRLQIIQHFKTCTTEIYLQNECAHGRLSIPAPVCARESSRPFQGLPLPDGAARRALTARACRAPPQNAEHIAELEQQLREAWQVRLHMHHS